MKEYQFTLRNIGMNRDLSVSKAGESSAYENVNIRITARDKDTLLSVTNERGNSQIPLTIEGTLVGWNVLNNHILLFTNEVIQAQNPPRVIDVVDRIYRIDYTPGAAEEFAIVRGNKITEEAALYTGMRSAGSQLGFNPEYPIESIVYAETDDIQKIYWVDGQHVLRFMNFMAELEEVVEDTTYLAPWEHLESDTIVSDNTYFDSNRAAKFTASATITKTNSGNSRPNGVVQYLLTYFNEHGQETGYIWVSDLVYLSPFNRGGAADETNNNSVSITLTGLDTTFSHFRLYSIFRSSYNGQVVAYIVSEQKTSSDAVTIIDDAAHLTVQDTTRLLYLGSQPARVGTMTHKDQTLFLGDLRSIGRNDYDALESIIRSTMFQFHEESAFTPGVTWEAKKISFAYSNTAASGTSGVDELSDIKYVDNIGTYPYSNQLSFSSSHILTFKGGEKYRFALKFQYKDGAETDAFWVGDKENPLYPVVDTTNSVIKRVVASCEIPAALVSYLQAHDFASVQLCIAEATYADRSIKAQGIVNPTMFNTWERFNNRVYSIPSWISRPRNASIANRHFVPVAKADKSFGEIQCNYWPEDDGAMVPFYRYKNYTSTPEYTDDYQGRPDYSHILLLYRIGWHGSMPVSIGFDANICIITGKVLLSDSEDPTATLDMEQYFFPSGDFKDSSWQYVDSNPDDADPGYYIHEEPSDTLFNLDGSPKIRFVLKAQYATVVGAENANGSDSWSTAAGFLYNAIQRDLVEKYSVPQAIVESIDLRKFLSWCTLVRNNANYIFDSTSNPTGVYYFTKMDNGGGWNQAFLALNHYDTVGSPKPSIYRWDTLDNITVVSSQGEYTPSYAKKNIMFVDENVVTLDSPELAFDAANYDEADLQFRLVGVARMSSVMSDYKIDATSSSMLGTNYDREQFSYSVTSGNPYIQGIISWPLWKEYGLDEKLEATYKQKDRKDMDIDDYVNGSSIVRYWMYMWQHSGVISGFSTNQTESNTEEGEEIADVNARKPSVLNDKTFANLHFSYDTVYTLSNKRRNLTIDGLRIARELGNSYYSIKVGDENKYYEGIVQLPLTMPWKMKYPIFYSRTKPESTSVPQTSDEYYLQSNAPVLLEYRSGTHAVISLHSSYGTVSGVSSYIQSVLPYVFNKEIISLPIGNTGETGAIATWTPQTSASNVIEYRIDQGESAFSFTAGDIPVGATPLGVNDQYLFIGELYKDFSENDTRYGGISLDAVQNSRFIAAGPQYQVDGLEADGSDTVFANQGDTYFQRWDCVKTKPYSLDATNKVIDITSFMVETHINLDGRTDRFRGMPELTSINLEQFGQLNTVYSQPNNFSVRRDLDDDFNTDSYRSSITWTLPKSDMADIDEWTHITLASTLKLDSDKGICRALRRFNNSIVAFQDRAVSEVLFNSRTQLTTNDGVPVEIANSGKVDGKRYISNKYGCVNKWSIAEGKAGVYWVDNINKAFCGFNGQIENLSEKLGFGVWFRDGNTLNPWTPKDWDNIISHYDKVHQDVYLVKKDSAVQPALVYNELLGRFTSFFNYGSMPMLTNVEDKLVSFHGSSMWLQNSGLYSNFFGQQYPFSVQYRVTPEPYGDKIWTNVEYRADFYRTLDENGVMQYDESELTETSEAYQKNETFDYMRFWNEYQTTDDSKPIAPVKKFRIWRLQIPRAQKDEQFNPYGLDRIRNPWLNLKFQKNYVGDDPETVEIETDETRQDLMQLHDITVKYFE